MTVDKSGVNAGLETLATGTEVEANMQRVVFNLEETGRLKFLPLHEWVPGETADGKLRNIVTGKFVDLKFGKVVFGNHQ